jgi:ArsR family transcriptional regulator, lead/cadmium/zinc/bismuth-responsive transcriptional repressor
MGPEKLPTCDAAKPILARRDLLSPIESEDLARLFGVLASATRLRLLHSLIRLAGQGPALDGGDWGPCMSDLAASVGMKPQAVSNQLRRLVDLGILATQRHGNHVHYRIEGALIPALLSHGLDLREGAP